MAVSKYDGTPVTGGAVTIRPSISNDGTVSNQIQSGGSQTQTLKKGIAEFEYTLGPDAQNMILTVIWRNEYLETIQINRNWN